MLWLDAFFRFSAVGLLLLALPLVLLCKNKSKPMVYMLVAQCFLLVHLLGFVPTVFESPQPFLLILRLLDVGLLAAVWVFVLSLFQRDFKIQNIHLSLGFFVSAIMLAERLVQYGYLNALPTWWAHLVNATAFSIAVHMVVVTVTGHNDDLLETRRQTRIHMMLLVALAVTLMIVLGSILLPEFQPTIHAISLWPLVFVMGFWVFRLDPAVFAFDTPQGKTPDDMSNKDRIIHGGLMALIVEKKYICKATSASNPWPKNWQWVRLH